LPYTSLVPRTGCKLSFIRVLKSYMATILSVD